MTRPTSDGCTHALSRFPPLCRQFLPCLSLCCDPFPCCRQIGAVVVGIDDRLTYTKIAYALAHLNRPADAADSASASASVSGCGGNGASRSESNRACMFISTNQDSTLPTAGHTLPGAGSCVAMLATAAGRTPINMGKPQTIMLDLAVEKSVLPLGHCARDLAPLWPPPGPLCALAPSIHVQHSAILRDSRAARPSGSSPMSRPLCDQCPCTVRICPWPCCAVACRFNLDKSRVLMVGDRLDTDIAFGINGAVDTLLITDTGIHTLDDALESGVLSTYSLGNVTQLLE